MDIYGIRKIALQMACVLDHHGDLAAFLEMARTIENYLMGREHLFIKE